MSEIIGIGTDLCDVARIEKAIQKEGFLNRVYSAAERTYLEQKGVGKAQSAAAMFAAKEAAAKAMGTGFTLGLMPADFSVEHMDNGRPVMHLSEKAEEMLKQHGGRKIHLTLSHEKGMAIAFVVIES